MRELFRTTHENPWDDPKTYLTCDWYFEPAHARSIFVYGKRVRCAWPDLVFAVVREGLTPDPSEHKIVALLVHGTTVDEGTELLNVTPTTPFLSMPWMVCLGEKAALAITRGTLKPIDAFWLTSFQTSSPVALIEGLHLTDVGLTPEQSPEEYMGEFCLTQ